MSIEKKWIFWLLAVFAMTLAAVPSVILYNAVQKYFGFMYSWKVGTLRPTKTQGVPAQRATLPRPQEKPQLEVRFVKFSMKAPEAKSVRIAADFNKWDPRTLALNRLKDGAWEAIIPLPTGRYNYLYEVDGVLMIDPRNPGTGYFDGRQTSVITVK